MVLFLTIMHRANKFGIPSWIDNFIQKPKVEQSDVLMHSHQVTETSHWPPAENL